MNKNQFRLIFNRARNMMMVVAETVQSHTSGSTTKSATDLHKNHAGTKLGSSGAASQAANQSLALRPVTFSIMLALGMVGFIPNSMSVNNAHADIIADQAAPANQRPIILNAPNGVPLVNIQTPSAAGVSRNTYSQFDVNTNGAILNNSRSNVQTQLGGFVQGNPYLATGTARIILNEVNSSNPSYLNGYIEVAGSRAQVVIANPAGISCTGCGFINASRATLTTGTPIFNGGDLMGYRVGGGVINFLGAGLDTSSTNYTDIIARAVNVNAGIWAQNLNIVTGTNQVNVASNGDITGISAISPNAGSPASAFAVDVAALGGMYAGKIHMVGTEAGLGVRNSGNINASAGNVVIDANGMLSNSGTISNSGVVNSLAINSQGLNNNGTISTQNNLSINNLGAVQNSGLITADRELKLDTSGQLTNNQGSISAQRLDIQAASLNNSQGTIEQTGLQALSLNTQGLININNAVIGNMPMVAGGTGSGGTTGNGNTGSGSTTATPPSTATGGSAVVVTPVAPVLLADGVINIQGLTQNDGGEIIANGNVGATVSHTLTNSAVINLNKIDFTGTTFSNANGSIEVAQAFINTHLLDNAQGQFIISDSLQLSAHDVHNYKGNLQQLGVNNLTLDLLGNLDNTQGRIETNAQSLTLDANQLINSGGSIIHAGTGTLNLTASTLNGTAGLIQSNGALNVAAQTATLDQATTIAQQISIDTATLSNIAGRITQIGTAATNIKATTALNNTSGTIASNGNTTFTVGSLNNQAGTIQAAGTNATGTGNLTINATGAIDNSALNTVAGNIQAGNSATLAASSLNNSQGNVSAGNALSVTTTSLIDGINNSQGFMAADQSVTLNAAAGINNTQAHIESAVGTISLTALGAFNNNLGNIYAAQSLNSNSFGFNNTSGKLFANDALLNSQSLTFNNTQGSIIATTNLDLQSGVLLNDAGLIQTGNNLTINTHSQTLSNNNSGTTKGLLSQGDLTLNTGDLNNQTGYIGAANTLTANSAVITNANGIISSEADITLNATSLNNQAGRVEAIGNVGINTGSAINNQSGLLRSGQTLTLTAASVDNRNTQGVNQGIEGQNVVIVSDAINNTLGAIRADDSLNITGSGSLNNSQGLISSTGTLHIADRVASANVNVPSKTLDVINTGGRITAQQNLNVDTRSLTGDGNVISNGSLNTRLTTDYTNATTGKWQAVGDASLVTTGTVTNQSLLSSGGNLSINAANINNLATGEISGFNTLLNVSNTLNNRGLIDGIDTFINANILNNIGTGRIYGDHVAIAANTLNNNTETVNSITRAAVIAARSRLDIGATAINNSNDSLLFSAGDMAIGGALDANHQAIGQAANLTNQGATIEALGNLTANVADLQNLNAGITTQIVDVGSTAYDQFTPRFANVILNAADYPGAQIGNVGVSWRSAGPYTFREYYRYLYTGYTSETQLLTSAPAQLLSGGNMTLLGNINNSDSKIIAGGALDATGASLNNLNTQGQSTTNYSGTLDYYNYDGSGKGFRYVIEPQGPYNPASSITTFNLPTTQVLQYTTVAGTATQVGALSSNQTNASAIGSASVNVTLSATNAQANNTRVDNVDTLTSSSVQTATNTQQTANVSAVDAANRTTTANVGAPSTSGAQPVNIILQTVTPNLTLPTNSLFSTNPNASNNYLVETDPRFADYRNWLSSDYMLSALSYDPATQTQRLGDGFYEQRLIREQVNQLTGQRFLTGYASDEDQYQALMRAGITVAQAWNLIPGVALTNAQIAQLTTDIVWLVEQSITLPNGTVTKALVPQVYARLRDGDLSNTGALLAGNSVKLNLTGDATNSGTIGSRTLLAMTADNIHNLGGRISANQLQLDAKQDINNIGGTISAQDSLILNAGRDINIESTTQSAQNLIGASSFSRTNLDRVAGLYVTNPSGTGILVASAGNNINLNAAQLQNDSNNANSLTSLKAGNDINLGTVQIAEQNSSVRNIKNYLNHGSTQDIGTQIQTQGDIALQAGDEINVRAATITSSEGALQGIAGGDITIENGEATSNMAAARTTKKRSGFSTTRTTTRDTYNDTTSIGSNLSADSINLVAGAQIAEDGKVTVQKGTGDINITSSNVVATQDVNLNAGRDITIESAQDTSSESHYNRVKRSGLSSSGASVTYGSSTLRTTNDTQTTTNVASTVGSIEGNVNINAGETYTQTGSDILTPAGDINIAAQSVTIQNATDTSANQQTMKYKQSGITLAVTSPVISAIQTAQQMATAASQTSDPRMQALAAGTAALAANNALDAVNAGNSSTPRLDNNGLEVLDANGMNSVQSANAADQVGGINVNLSIGSSKSSSETEQTSTTVVSSHLKASGSININATGAGQQSDINIIGSQATAGHNVNLTADDEINLQAAQNTATLNSTNRSSAASIGIAIDLGAGGAGVSANASFNSGRGSANGTDVTWTETIVQGANTVTLNSGRDTNIIGSQVIGNRVVANVGTSGTGNLNIISLQDSSTYTDKQSSSGISVSVPITGAGSVGGSINSANSAINANFASVNEQAGIFAGDEGFQANVNGNTNLTGAVMASSEAAANSRDANGKPINQLTTQTLTTSNIQNVSEYEASSSSTGISLSYNPAQSITRNIGSNLVNLPSTLAPDLNQNGSNESVTTSAVSLGQVTIKDDTKQTATTGQNATTTVALLNRDVANANVATLTRPDIEAIQQEQAANSAIVSAATVQVTQAVNSYYTQRIAEYDQRYNQTINQAQDLEAQAASYNAAGNTSAAELLNQHAQSLRSQAVDIRNERDAPALSQGLAQALGTALIGGLAGQVNVGQIATSYSVGSLGSAFLLTAQRRDSDVTQGFVVTCNAAPSACAEQAASLGNQINNANTSLEERIGLLQGLQTINDKGEPVPAFEINIVDSNSAANTNIAVNGILNQPDRAMVLGIGHLRDGETTGQSLYLSYNDTQGVIPDLLNAFIDQTTRTSSNPSLAAAQAISAAGANNATNLYAHSGGTLISNIALNSLPSLNYTNTNLHVDYFGPASTMTAAATAALNVAGLSNATPLAQNNWLRYGNVNGLPVGITKPEDIADYIRLNSGAGYFNHPNDPVATFIGFNFGQSNQYNNPQSPSYLQGATQGNVVQSFLELYDLFTTSDSAHSTYRWNDPATWPTRAVTPNTTTTQTTNQVSTGSQP